MGQRQVFLRQKKESSRYHYRLRILKHSKVKTFEETYKRLEKMDDVFYSVVPSFEDLLELYLDPSDDRVYTHKDLYAHYRRRYIVDQKLDNKGY
jgi:hypothetical protein